MKTPEQIEIEVKEVFSGSNSEFRPCAFFDEQLDCIRVIARECSIVETRVTERFTVLKDMYAREGRYSYVGFTIKGARHFCAQNGWDLKTPISISALLDRITLIFPDNAVKFFVDGIARELVQAQNIEQVDVSAAILQPA